THKDTHLQLLLFCLLPMFLFVVIIQPLLKFLMSNRKVYSVNNNRVNENIEMDAEKTLLVSARSNSEDCIEYGFNMS
ncbi:hypothetical protein L9F63_018755, partial [Diploptera punctata]